MMLLHGPQGHPPRTGASRHLETGLASPLQAPSSHRSLSFSLSYLKPTTPSVGPLFFDTPWVMKVEGWVDFSRPLLFPPYVKPSSFEAF